MLLAVNATELQPLWLDVFYCPAPGSRRELFSLCFRVHRFVIFFVFCTDDSANRVRPTLEALCQPLNIVYAEKD